jgi:hypothetical protein
MLFQAGIVSFQCPDSEVRSPCGPTFTNFGIERTLAKLLIQFGFCSEVRMMNLQQALMRTSERHIGSLILTLALRLQAAGSNHPPQDRGFGRLSACLTAANALWELCLNHPLDVRATLSRQLP